MAQGDAQKVVNAAMTAGEPRLYSAAYPWNRRTDMPRGGVDHITGKWCDVLPTMTRQEHAEECDINVLMQRYDKAGAMPMMFPGNSATPQYFDATQLPQDLQGVMQFMMEAENAFMQLPASVRKTFENDPVKFVEFASDNANIDKMREWGLAPKPEAPAAPLKVEIAESQKGWFQVNSK